MTLSDITERWRTDRTEDFSKITDDSAEIISYAICEAPLGDIVGAYVNHLCAPFWKRWWSKKWRQVEEKLKEILNQSSSTITWHER